MNTKNMCLLVLICGLSSFNLSSADYQEVNCSTDPAFAANSCIQCFNGGGKSEGESFGFLSDDWINPTGGKQIVYKEEQKLPYMVNLSGDAASWVQTPSEADFWDWTPEFNALYDEKEEGYILPAGEKVTWLKSKLGYAYTLEKNSAAAGTNIGMLIYTVKPHNIAEDGQVSIEDVTHSECVLFTSLTTPVTPPAPEPPDALPKTGPEQIILVFLALLLGFGLLRYTKRA